MAVNPGDVIRVDAVGLYDGTEDIINTFQYQLGALFAQTEADVLTDVRDIVAAFYGIVNALLVARTIFDRIRAYNLTQDVLLGELAFTTPIVGTGGSNSDAPGIAGLLSLKTIYSRVVLRKYLGPLAKGLIDDDGNITTAGVAVLTNGAAYLLAQQAKPTGDYRYGYLSPVVGGFVTPNTASVTNNPAYQRRRRRGTGS